ncbi:MAG: hypothetical protein ACP5II_05700 [Infirmifilum sp.]|jgi:hypothetical protein|uniref:hypothetical protein n=1 Tax=Infirmifilum TaxID=2856573 RepID=UPI0023569F09
MAEERVITVDGHLRVLPSEIRAENIVKIGAAVSLNLSFKDVTLRARKISTIGVVKSVFKGRSFQDYTLSFEEHEVIVRVWPDKIPVETMGWLVEGTPVLVYGMIREFNGVIYVSATLIKKVPETYFEVFKRQLVVDRELILRSITPTKT